MTFDIQTECCKHLPVSYDYQCRLNRRSYRRVTMTIDELRAKSDDELTDMKIEGKITDNEYLLSAECYSDLYLTWLDGREPTDETAKEFIPLADHPEKILGGQEIDY